MPDPFKIDAHVHVFTTDMPLIDNPRHAPTYSFTHEELIATLDRERRRPRGDRGGEPLGRLQRLHAGGAARARQAVARHRDLPPSDGTLRTGGDGPRRFCRHTAALHRPAAASRHHHLRLSRAVSPPRRSRLACASPCRRRGSAENPADAGGLWRQDRGRSSRPPRSRVRHQQRRLQGAAAIDRQGPHLGEGLRRLPARATGDGLCARAAPRRRSRPAGVGERLPVRRP